MNEMDPEILNYIKTERVGVIAVQMPDGSVHGATVHFAASENSLVFYFQTFAKSRKAESFMNGQKSVATFVIGTSEEKMKTMQFDGEVEIVKPEDKATCEEVYLGKFPEKAERAKDPNAVYFTFKPTWWRYSDMKHPEGKLILTSQ